MPTRLPHHYIATVTRTGASRAAIAAAPRPQIAGSPPPEFDGPADTWSPEHLLLGSIGLCLETTFDALAARAKLAVASWQATIECNLERTAAGVELGGFEINVQIEVAPDEVDLANEVLAQAHHQCFVSNALRAPATVTATVRATSAAA